MLLDLDAFFASVEQLDHPEWLGKPVIVGGDADSRGVVSTCSYEARKFGVRSAMPASTAARLCPDAIWVRGNFARYRELSNKVMDIMRSKSPWIQQVSIDEAFLDITPSPYGGEHPVAVASFIQDEVAKLGITCSIGLSTCKSVAKVASDRDKPRGLTVVFPGREKDFLRDLPTKDMSGIGPVAQRELARFGITTLGEVAEADEEVLHAVFGKNAESMRLRCLGADTDPVAESDVVKSVSNEMSFASDISTRSDVEAAIATVAAKLGRRLRMKGIKCSGVVLKVKYADMSVRSSSAKLREPSDNEFEFMEPLMGLLDELWEPGVPLRLVGVSTSHLDEHEDTQLSLFDDDENPASGIRSDKKTGLVDALDAVRNRFGEHSVGFGSELRTRGNLTGSSSKNPADYK